MVNWHPEPQADTGVLPVRKCGVALAGTIAAVMALSPAVTLAHAHLVSSDPEDGTVVDTATPDLALTFSEEIEADFSTFTLTASDSGDAMENGLVSNADDDPATIVLTVTEPLSPGAYILQWEVLALDGHATGGEIAFTVAE